MDFVVRYARFTTLLLALSLYRCRTGNSTLVCKEGQFRRGGVCKDCQSPCKQCISEFACADCEAGFYGDKCTSNCSESCVDKICLKDTGRCVHCAKGFYLDDDRTCLKCPNRCLECLSQTECTVCKLGLMGTLCQEQCVNCKEDSACSLLHGVCLNGCKDGYSGPLCKEHCGLSCRSCERSNKSRCKSCVKGTHGTFCEKHCPVNCVDNICEQDDGACKNECKNGYWGDKCEDLCPRNCFSNACVKSSGVCLDGCQKNFSGSKCLCPRDCTCDSEGFCQGCSNKSEIMCNDFCSKGCVNFVCWRNSAKCLDGCKEGHQGETCTQVPDVRCEECHPSAILVIISATSACVTVVLLTTFCINKMRKCRNPMIQKRKGEAYDLDNINYSTIPDHILEQTAVGQRSAAARTLAPHSTAGDITQNYFSSLGTRLESVCKPSAHTPAADRDAYRLLVSKTASDLDNRQATKITLCHAEVSTDAYITPVYTTNVVASGHKASHVSEHTTEGTQDYYLTPQNRTLNFEKAFG